MLRTPSRLSAYTWEGMIRFLSILAMACCVIAPDVSADEAPDTGKFLVATEEVQGPSFEQTVILLLHYDENGAMGLVINRPAGASPAEAVPDLKGLARYRGELYYGGPVRLHTMRTLLRTDSPPEDALQIVDAVYLTDVDEEMLLTATSDAVIRFYAGYAGWSAGQLEYEIRRGSWDVIRATADQVFSDDPESMWGRLQPQREYRASLQHR